MTPCSGNSSQLRQPRGSFSQCDMQMCEYVSLSVVALIVKYKGSVTARYPKFSDRNEQVQCPA